VDSCLPCLQRPFPQVGDIVNCLYRNGNVIEYKQDPIPETKYHNQIQHDYEKASHQDGEPEVRYWSDFNRLYYAPKTVQRLPDIADWENAEGNWQEGRDTCKRLDEVHSSYLFSNFWMPIRPDIFHLAGNGFNGEFTSGFCRGMLHLRHLTIPYCFPGPTSIIILTTCREYK
jgi:hypothetical protein